MRFIHMRQWRSKLLEETPWRRKKGVSTKEDGINLMSQPSIQRFLGNNKLTKHDESSGKSKQNNFWIFDDNLKILMFF